MHRSQLSRSPLRASPASRPRSWPYLRLSTRSSATSIQSVWHLLGFPILTCCLLCGASRSHTRAWSSLIRSARRSGLNNLLILLLRLVLLNGRLLRVWVFCSLLCKCCCRLHRASSTERVQHILTLNYPFNSVTRFLLHLISRGLGDVLRNTRLISVSLDINSLNLLRLLRGFLCWCMRSRIRFHTCISCFCWSLF